MRVLAGGAERRVALLLIAVWCQGLVGCAETVGISMSPYSDVTYFIREEREPRFRELRASVCENPLRACSHVLPEALLDDSWGKGHVVGRRNDERAYLNALLRNACAIADAMKRYGVVQGSGVGDIASLRSVDLLSLADRYSDPPQVASAALSLLLERVPSLAQDEVAALQRSYANIEESRRGAGFGAPVAVPPEIERETNVRCVSSVLRTPLAESSFRVREGLSARAAELEKQRMEDQAERGLARRQEEARAAEEAFSRTPEHWSQVLVDKSGSYIQVLGEYQGELSRGRTVYACDKVQPLVRASAEQLCGTLRSAKKSYGPKFVEKMIHLAYKSIAYRLGDREAASALSLFRGMSEESASAMCGLVLLPCR